MIAELANEIWYGRSMGARIARVLLLPAAKVFEVATTRRARAYERGDRQQVESAIPVVSVGNLTVGGTGKTPFAAMLVGKLREMGRTPAIVMRGYGADEPILHEWLNPGVHVYTTPDRAAGIARAAADGADVGPGRCVPASPRGARSRHRARQCRSLAGRHASPPRRPAARADGRTAPRDARRAHGEERVP